MSTNCNIAIVLPDETVKSIYVHFDGYPEGVGAVLDTFYRNELKIKRLMDLGDLSSLGETPEVPANSQQHRVDKATGEYIYCDSYANKGESNTEAKLWATLSEFLKNATKEYTYIWMDSTWYYRHEDNDLKLLVDKLHKHTTATNSKEKKVTSVKASVENSNLIADLQAISARLSTLHSDIQAVTLMDLISFPEEAYRVLEKVYRTDVYAINSLSDIIEKLKNKK